VCPLCPLACCRVWCVLCVRRVRCVRVPFFFHREPSWPTRASVPAQVFAKSDAVGAWQSVPMNQRTFPKGNVYNQVCACARGPAATDACACCLRLACCTTVVRPCFLLRLSLL
jgi:hypothetical protein